MQLDGHNSGAGVDQMSGQRPVAGSDIKNEITSPYGRSIDDAGSLVITEGVPAPLPPR